MNIEEFGEKFSSLYVGPDELNNEYETLLSTDKLLRLITYLEYKISITPERYSFHDRMILGHFKNLSENYSKTTSLYL